MATTAHRKSGVAMGAGFMQEFEHGLFKDRFTDDGDTFHGMQVHGWIQGLRCLAASKKSGTPKVILKGKVIARAAVSE